MASGMPSRRRQISSTAAAVAGGIEARPRRGGAFTNSRLGLGQRGHPPGDLAGATQRLAAGGQNVHAGRGAQNLLGQAGARVDQVLAVVEHEQRFARRRRWAASASRAERAAGIGTPTASAAAWATSAGSLRLARSMNHAPSGSCATRVGSDLERQPRLAAAAGAGERHQPGAPQQARDVRALALAADERGQLAREVAASRPRPVAAGGGASSCW